jgi:glycosyltransferase involved in cell wall biosynthesis
MKILMLNHNFAWQGTFFRCYHFARHLMRRGHRVTILTVRPDRAIWPQVTVEQGVRIIKTPRPISKIPIRLARRWLIPGVLWRLALVLGEEHEAVIAFDHWPEVACPLFLAKLARRRRLVSDWADLWTQGGILEAKFRPGTVGYHIESWLELRTKRVADSVTTISQLLRDRAVAAGVPAKRVWYLPSGADIENITPLGKGEARRACGLPAQGKIIAYAGVSTAAEARLLVEAFVLIEREVPEARLLLIGPFERGMCQEGLDPALKAKILSPGVIPYACLGAYLSAADLLALPLPDTMNSRARWPNKFGDYLAAGRPIVATSLGDLEGIFREHPIGLAAEPDTEHFARQAVQLLRDPDRAEACGRAARHLAESQLDWSLLAGRLETILECAA